MSTGANLGAVIPAKAGIQRLGAISWIPAFAGMTLMCKALAGEEQKP